MRTKNEDLILIFRDGSFLFLLSFLLTPKKRAKSMGQMSLATENRAAPVNAAEEILKSAR